MTDNLYGSNGHAELVTEGRHPSTRDALLWLTYRHLPEALQSFSSPFYAAAVSMINNVGDSPELTKALNALTEAKDWNVRAGIRTQQGRAGSIPRPQTVVDPPQLSGSVHDTGARAEADRMRDRLPETD